MKKKCVFSTVLDKSTEQKKVKKKLEVVKFNLKSDQLSCFISKQPHNNKKIQKQQIQQNFTFKQNVQTQIMKSKLFRYKNPHLEEKDRVFQNKVLLLQYGQKDMYIDEDKSNEVLENNEQINQLQYDFQTPCFHVMTEETNHSSHRRSNKQARQDTTPSSTEGVQNPFFCDYGYLQQVKQKEEKNKNRFKSIFVEQNISYAIDLNKVEIDGRTTIMIKNLPNKYTQEDLLILFEKNHKKKFDFFYLPMDYNNNCNLGYAFLNFIHPKFITEFYLEFHKKKWKKFNSFKICEVCYATIQGTAKITNHFQGSNAIQQKQKKFRPLIGMRQFTDINELLQKQKQKQTN